MKEMTSRSFVWLWGQVLIEYGLPGVAGTPYSQVINAMGNTITDDLGRQYGYDAASRLAIASTGSSILEYRVGVDGLRTGKTVTAPAPQELFYAYADQRRLIGV